MENIGCILNGENRDIIDPAYKLCGQKIVSNTFTHCYKGITLLWKGHLYNRSIDQKSSVSDPLCIIRYYLKKGIYKTLRKINGDFSFILLDPRITEDSSVLYVAMDIFGKYPLYSNTLGHEIYITDILPLSTTRRSYSPSCYSTYSLSHKVHSIWTPQHINSPYYIAPIPMPPLNGCSEQHSEKMRNLLLNNIQRRFEAYEMTKDNATVVMLMEEQNSVCFKNAYDAIKYCGFTPIICSIRDELLQEEHEYSRLFVVSISHKFFKETDHILHHNHTVLYPCMDVFYLQLHLLLGFYF